MKGKKKRYEIDDIMGILACDKDDQQLLDEYLAEKYLKDKPAASTT